MASKGKSRRMHVTQGKGHGIQDTAEGMHALIKNTNPRLVRGYADGVNSSMKEGPMGTPRKNPPCPI